MQNPMANFPLSDTLVDALELERQRFLQPHSHLSTEKQSQLWCRHLSTATALGATTDQAMEATASHSSMGLGIMDSTSKALSPMSPRVVYLGPTLLVFRSDRLISDSLRSSTLLKMPRCKILETGRMDTYQPHQLPSRCRDLARNSLLLQAYRLTRPPTLRTMLGRLRPAAHGRLVERGL